MNANEHARVFANIANVDGRRAMRKMKVRDKKGWEGSKAYYL